jgi:hypothetical protein
MENEQQFYILKPDGSINFLNLAFYTALQRQDWINNPENSEKIENYEKVLQRPYKYSDIEALEVKYKVNFSIEFKEYFGKITREVFLRDYPVLIKYESIEEALQYREKKLESELQFRREEIDNELIEKCMIQIGLYENGDKEYIYLGGGKYFGSIWKSSGDNWELVYKTFREYVLIPFSN